jgi:AraC-like DNA-binding protein
MNFGIELEDYNFVIKLENCRLRIIGGNWGEFKVPFTNHMHSYYELHYVCGGQGTLITDALKMPLYKGCLYLLPPRTNHEQWSNHSDYLQEYYLAFEVTSMAEKDIIWSYLLSKGYYNDNQKVIEYFFDNITKESLGKQYGYLNMIYQNIQAIFITLIRSTAKLYNELSTPPGNMDDKRSMFIDLALIYESSTLTLSTLSNQLNLSTRQTQRFIQDKYGFSFSTLKLQSRLNHAAMLLSTTKQPLDEICAQIGYKNYSFFSRLFKQYYHMTPTNYRKSHNQQFI